MNRIICTFLALGLSSCAVAQKSPGTVSTQQLDIQQGAVRWVTFSVPKDFENGILTCRDQQIKHASWKDGLRQAYIAESYFSPEGAHQCLMTLGTATQPLINFNVKQKKFSEERLRVDFRKIKLSPKDQARAEKEQVILNALYKKSAPTPYFQAAFRPPLDSTITSIYGMRRLYNKKHRSQHLGTDFRAAIGVPVPVANRGRVMFAGDLFYTGGTVIVDHGMDIFTVYGHLSEVKTQEGEVVNQGDIIGLAGNTGRSSGPHLHWGVKIHGNYIDGYTLIEETKRQFP